MLNKALIIGRVGRDAEKKTESLCTFSVATTEKWKTKDGEQKEKTTWHNVQAWGKLSEICSQYVKKGMLVYVEGSIEHQEWKDNNGQKKSGSAIKALTVQFLERKEQTGGF